MMLNVNKYLDDSVIASKFKAVIHILFIFGRIVKTPLFGTTLV